jgi:hypothetical protein
MKSQVTVAITRHDESDELFLGALEALSGQKKITITVLVLDQCSAPEVELFCSNKSNAMVCFHYILLAPCGISRARNRAISLSETNVLLFTEPDARADEYWAYYLHDALCAGAAVAGGLIVPQWTKMPPFAARSGLIMDMYSLLDLGDGRRKTEKVVGCNFGINIEHLGVEHSCFNERYGRAVGGLMGGEETELCRRAISENLSVVYDGRALVTHIISSERIRYRWLAKRIHAAGKSRARDGGLPRPTNPSRFGFTTLLASPLYVCYVLGYLSYKLGAVNRIQTTKGES